MEESSQLGEGQGKNSVRKVAFEKCLEGWGRFQEAEIEWWGVHPCLWKEFVVRAVKGRIPKRRRSDCKCGLCLDLKGLNEGWESNGELLVASHYSCVYWARYLTCLSLFPHPQSEHANRSFVQGRYKEKWVNVYKMLRTAPAIYYCSISSISYALMIIISIITCASISEKDFLSLCSPSTPGLKVR